MGQLMRECGVITFRAMEVGKGRHLDKVRVYPVERSPATIADIRAGMPKKAL